jgi:ferredoxin
MSRESRVAIDRIACTGYGLCAELFPEHLTLDEWGFPVQTVELVQSGELRHARRAVASCPALALRLVSRQTRSAV